VTYFSILFVYVVLSKGDPTLFGNLPVAESIQESVIQTIRDGKHNGYAPSIGKAMFNDMDRFNLVEPLYVYL